MVLGFGMGLGSVSKSELVRLTVLALPDMIEETAQERAIRFVLHVGCRHPWSYISGDVKPRRRCLTLWPVMPAICCNDL